MQDRVDGLIGACVGARVVRDGDGRVTLTGLDLDAVDRVSCPRFVPAPSGVGVGADDLVWSGILLDERWWLVLGGSNWHVRSLGFWRVLDAEGKFLGSSDSMWPYKGWEPFGARVVKIEVIPIDEVADVVFHFDDGRVLQVMSRSAKFSWWFEAVQAPSDEDVVAFRS